MEINYVIENIVDVMSDYKIKTLDIEDNTSNKIIRECLSNNTDFLMREKINSPHERQPCLHRVNSTLIQIIRN